MATAAALPDSRDLVATWSFLEEGVDHIMTRLTEGMSYSKYMYGPAFPRSIRLLMQITLLFSGIFIRE